MTNPDDEERIIAEAQRRRRRMYVALGIGLAGMLAGLLASRATIERSRALGGLFLLLGLGVFLGCAATWLITWRCPKCDAYLGRNPDPKHCPRCGARLL